jgi:hypothetical protein
MNINLAKKQKLFICSILFKIKVILTMKKIKYVFLLSAVMVSPFALAQAVTGTLTGSALVQSIALSASSQVAVNVGLGPLESSTAVATITPGSQTGSIAAETLTPSALVSAGAPEVTATGPGSTASATGIYSSNVLTVVPVLNGTQAVTSLTVSNTPVIPD